MSRLVKSIFVICFLCSAISQAQQRPLLDSLYEEVWKSKGDSLKVILLCHIADQITIQELEKYYTTSKKAYFLAEQLNFRRGLAEAAVRLGKALFRKGSLENSRQFLLEANAHFILEKDNVNSNRVLLLLGEISHRLGNYAEALEYYQRLVEKTPDNYVEVWNKMGNVHKDLGNYDKALQYYDKATNRDTIDILSANTLGNLGQLYYQQKRYKDALIYYKRTLKQVEKTQSTQATADVLLELGDVYSKLDSSKQALINYRNAEILQKGIGDELGLIKTYLRLTQYYRGKQAFKKAVELGNKSLKMAQKAGALPKQKEALHELAELAENMGYVSKALSLQKKYNVLRDTLLNTQSMRRIDQLETRFAFETKEKEIELLVKQNKINELQVKRDSILRYVLILAMGLMLIFATLLWKRYTERNKAAVIIKESADRYRAVVEQSLVIIYVMDVETEKVLEANYAFYNTLGYDSWDIENLRSSSFSQHEKKDIRDKIEKIVTYDEVFIGERIWRSKQGKLLNMQVAASKIKQKRKDVISVVALDITKSKKNELALKQSQEQLRKLSTHLQEVREEEASRIARELHDELGQSLTALKIDIAMLQRKLSEHAKSSKELLPLSEKMKDMIITASETMNSVRRISANLRPAALDDMGVIAAMEWFAGDFSERTGIQCNLDLQLTSIPNDKKYSVGIFRIFQESLTNVARHAKATEVSILLIQNDKSLILEILDNGIGVDMEKITQLDSFGIVGMRERAIELGGHLTVTKSDSNGTEVKLVAPIA